LWFIHQCCEYFITFYIISRVRSLIFWENLRERSHLEDLGVDRRTIIKKGIQEIRWRVWAGLIWLGTGTDGETWQTS
jgi:hypothetical protein